MDNSSHYETGCQYLGEFVEDAALTRPDKSAQAGRGMVVETHMVGIFVDDARGGTTSALKDFVFLRRDHSSLTVTGNGVRKIRNGHNGKETDGYAVVLRDADKETVLAEFQTADLLGVYENGVNLLPPEVT